jgi:hypothetical protein
MREQKGQINLVVDLFVSFIAFDIKTEKKDRQSPDVDPSTRHRQ